MKIYLDHNSTTSVVPSINDAMVFAMNQPLNPSSVHYAGQKAREIVENARANIAKALSINLSGSVFDIIFTSSGTEANNMVMSSWQDYIQIVGATEHWSILAANDDSVNLVQIPVDDNGIIDNDELERVLGKYNKNIFLSIMLANNETGVIQDIRKLALIAKKYGAILHCDASQAFGKIPVNFENLGCDLMTISSHKCGGPQGAAAVIYRKHLPLKSLIRGGKQERGFRAGTENVVAIHGFGLAAALVSKRIDQNQKISLLRDKIEIEISRLVPEAKFFGQKVMRLPNTTSIYMPNVNSQTQLIRFDLADIAISAGAACSAGVINQSHVLRAMHVPDKEVNNTIRVSLGPHNNEAEISIFINTWLEICHKNNFYQEVKYA